MKITPLKTKIRGVAGLILLLGIENLCLEEKPRIECRGEIVYEDKDLVCSNQGEIFLKQQRRNPSSGEYEFTGAFIKVIDLDENMKRMGIKGVGYRTKIQTNNN